MSTLLADTIRKTGGTAGVDIRVKNTSVYESDGGTSVTQNLVQGLCKSWVDIPADGASLNDSFNIGSSVDSGTGDRRVAFTNSMATANYAITTGVLDFSAGTSFILADISSGTQATTGFDSEVYSGSSSSNRTNLDEESYYVISGDLA